MVLWEITLATAYFLGLKRTYRYALRIQRRIILPNFPKTRLFVYRRTRATFNVATKIHRSIQERDIKLGRNLGGSIMRWLDQMKLSTQIRSGLPTNGTSSSMRTTQNVADTSNHKVLGYKRLFKRGSDTRLLLSSSSIWTKSFPGTIARIMRPPNLVGTTTHFRRLSSNAHSVSGINYGINWSTGVFRKDIMQWMLQS